MKMKINYVPKGKKTEKKQRQRTDSRDDSRSILCTLGVPEGGQRENEAENIFAKLMPKNSPNLMKYTNLQSRNLANFKWDKLKHKQKSIAFRYTNNKQLESRIVEKTPSITATEIKTQGYT